MNSALKATMLWGRLKNALRASPNCPSVNVNMLPLATAPPFRVQPLPLPRKRDLVVPGVTKLDEAAEILLLIRMVSVAMALTIVVFVTTSGLAYSGELVVGV